MCLQPLYASGAVWCRSGLHAKTVHNGPAAIQCSAETMQELQDLPLPVHEERAFQSVAGLTLEHAAGMSRFDLDICNA